MGWLDEAPCNKRVLGTDCANGIQIAQPSTSVCRLTRHPVLEKKSNEEMLMTHRGETGWRHWSLSAAKAYTEPDPKSVHCCQPSGTEEPWGKPSLVWNCRGCWTRRHHRGRGAAWCALPWCPVAVGASRERTFPVLPSVGTPAECEQGFKLLCFGVCSKYSLSPKKGWDWHILHCW